MSKASKVVLGLSIVLSISTIAGVHIKQNWDRLRLRDGVLRDLERVERKRENLRALEEQIQLTRQLVNERDRQEADAARPHSS
ncbi:protein PET117 homolog, mitochondrial isoform X2 [Sinocyclocheilus rhinocerous]|uniref:protein PET117 homolog, mitochondrial isoform X2 n=1 Tax=Sinocyclocheilus rhinocerous TaxID=307959 RepID=UPI0007B9139C|nr:PREDICTED: protein PET117 homolog, mitochondrial-like isoform X2 [Sinocyclocheilus rhinocerous]